MTSKAPPKGLTAKPPASPPRQANATALGATVNGATTGAAATGPQSRVFVELTPHQRRDLRRGFDLFDTEGTGRVPAVEIKVALRALGFEVRKEELTALLATVGTTPAGSMDFNEFLRVILLKVSERESKEEVLRAFKTFDEDDTGVIAFDDLKQISRRLGQRLTDDELMEMMEFAKPRAARGKGEVGAASGPSWRSEVHITEEDFMRLMKRANVY